MSFDISFRSPEVDFVELDGPALKGSLTIGELNIPFLSPLNAWVQRDYEEQWIRGCSRLIAGAASSALITAVQSPSTGDYDVFMFELFREGEIAMITERCIWDAPHWAHENDVYEMVRAQANIEAVQATCSLRELSDFLTVRG